MSPPKRRHPAGLGGVVAQITVADQATKPEDSTSHRQTEAATPAVEMALRFARRGWPVFPCRPEAKIPATAHGFRDATTDPDQIRRWWESCPAANLAIATGAPGPDVLDVDVKHVDGLATLERLRRVGLVSGPSMIVTTPSGGVHLYYLGSDEPNHTLARHGIDLRGRGGYVVAPGSVVDGNPYRVVDERDTAARLCWPRVAGFLEPPRPRPHQPIDEHSNVEHLARWVAGQPEGNRNAGLYWAARRAIDANTDPINLVDAAVSAGLSELEARRTIASAQRGAHQ